MKRIKSFKIFESTDGDGKLVDINHGREIRNSIAQNDFDKFKELTIDLTSDRARRSSQILTLRNAAEWGRVEFVEYLLNKYNYSNDEIKGTIEWVGHSAIPKRTDGDVDSVLDILHGLSGRRF